MALADFLNNFISNKKSYQIDSLNFFTIKMEFMPTDSNVRSLLDSMIEPKNVTAGLYDLTMFVQNIDLPSLNIVNDTAAETIVGSIQTHKLFVTPSDQTFKMSIINTRQPLVENWLYPWLREINTPAWIYPDRPYTTAKFTIDFSGKENEYHSNVKYILNGVRPTSITPLKPTQEVNQKLDRDVTFTFDYIYIQQASENWPSETSTESFMINPIVL